MLLALRLLDQIRRLPVKPPVTLGLMAFQAILHLAPETIGVSARYLVQDSALLPAAIVMDGDVQRLVMGQFLHGNDMHLYYNMASFLWKGVSLETSLGSEIYALTLAGLLVLTGVIHCTLSTLMFWTDTLHPESFFTPVVGFSGVLFALKMIMNFDAPTTSVSSTTNFDRHLVNAVYSTFKSRSSARFSPTLWLMPCRPSPRAARSCAVRAPCRAAVAPRCRRRRARRSATRTSRRPTPSSSATAAARRRCGS